MRMHEFLIPPLPLLFIAGLASSAGPCVAPRFIAVAALCAKQGRAAAVLSGAAFIGGLICAFAVFGAAGSFAMSAIKLSTGIYLVLAVALFAGGMATLCAPDACGSLHPCSGRVRWSAPFLLGSSSALIVSPCCTPLLLAIAAYSSAADAPIAGAVLCAVYGAGHALPLMAAALSAGSIGSIFERLLLRRAASAVSGGIMLALAGYYGVLA